MTHFSTSLLIANRLGKSQVTFSTGILVEFCQFVHFKKSLPEMLTKSDQNTRVRCRRPNDENNLLDDLYLRKSLRIFNRDILGGFPDLVFFIKID